MKALKVKITLVAAFIALTALAFSVPAALGWFRTTDNNDYGGIPAGTFKATLSVGFTGDDGGVLRAEGNLIKVDIHDPQSATYISRLKVSAEVAIASDAVMRISVKELWEQNIGGEITTPRLSSVPFDIDSQNFLDNSAADSCYYYRDKAKTAKGEEAFFLTPSDSGKSFAVIKGLKEETLYASNVTLTLYIRAELVQANRAEAFWGSLPPLD